MKSTASSYFIPSSISASATITGARPRPATQCTATQESGFSWNLFFSNSNHSLTTCNLPDYSTHFITETYVHTYIKSRTKAQNNDVSVTCTEQNASCIHQLLSLDRGSHSQGNTQSPTFIDNRCIHRYDVNVLTRVGGGVPSSNSRSVTLMPSFFNSSIL